MEHEYGLIGYPLKHSASPAYFAQRFDELELKGHVYKLFPINAMEQLPELLLKHTQLRGLNVTIPYKEKVVFYLDQITPEAQEIGAVNCIRVRQTKADLRLEGTNTDLFGFTCLLEATVPGYNKNALVLGNGGASKAVQYVLKQKGIPFIVVTSKKIDHGNNDQQIGWSDLTPALASTFSLVIQTTPLGMFPEIEKMPPYPIDAIQSHMVLIDLIYNPEETTFMKAFRAAGAQAENGIIMLHAQAEASLTFWGI